MKTENREPRTRNAAFLRRTIHPVTKILDAAKGIVEYVASDETLDSYHEIIRADGWRFTNFKKNAPFVDSHDYSTIKNLVGEVLDFKVAGGQLVETVRWAKDVAGNTLAKLGWDMTEAGFLKAVSVGFWPTKFVTSVDGKEYQKQLTELGLEPDTHVRTIFTEQEQVELSAVIIGANPNALAKAYKAGLVSDDLLESISQQYAERTTATAAPGPDAAALALHREREAWLERFVKATRTQ